MRVHRMAKERLHEAGNFAGGLALFGQRFQQVLLLGVHHRGIQQQIGGHLNFTR